MERKKLIEIANELTELIGLEPAIPTGKRVSDEEILASIKEAFTLVQDDEVEDLSKDAQALKKEVEKPAKPAKEETKKPAAKKAEPEPDEDEDDEDDEDDSDDSDDDSDDSDDDDDDSDDEVNPIESMKERIEEAKKINELKKLLKDELFAKAPKELKAIEDVKKLAKGMNRWLDNLTKAPEEKKTPAPEAPAKKKNNLPPSLGFTRMMAIAEIMKKDPSMPKDEVLEAADELYVKKGGKPNIRECAFYYPKCVDVFKVLGLIK